MFTNCVATLAVSKPQRRRVHAPRSLKSCPHNSVAFNFVCGLIFHKGSSPFSRWLFRSFASTFALVRRQLISYRRSHQASINPCCSLIYRALSRLRLAHLYLKSSVRSSWLGLTLEKLKKKWYGFPLVLLNLAGTHLFNYFYNTNGNIYFELKVEWQPLLLMTK